MSFSYHALQPLQSQLPEFLATSILLLSFAVSVELLVASWYYNSNIWEPGFLVKGDSLEHCYHLLLTMATSRAEKQNMNITSPVFFMSTKYHKLVYSLISVWQGSYTHKISTTWTPEQAQHNDNTSCYAWLNWGNLTRFITGWRTTGN